MAPAFFHSSWESKKPIISNNTNFDYFKALFHCYLYEEMNPYYTLIALFLPWWICSNYLGNHLNYLLGPKGRFLKHFHQNRPVLTFCWEVFLERDMPGDWGTWELRASSKTSWARELLKSHSWRGREAPAEVGRWEGKQSSCWGSQAVRATFPTPYIKSNWWDPAWQSLLGRWWAQPLAGNVTGLHSGRHSSHSFLTQVNYHVGVKRPSLSP